MPEEQPVDTLMKWILGIGAGLMVLGIAAVIALSINNDKNSQVGFAKIDVQMSNLSEKIGDLQKSQLNFVTQDQFKSAKENRDSQYVNLIAMIADNKSRIGTLENRMDKTNR